MSCSARSCSKHCASYWRGLRRKPADWLFPGNRWHTASHPVTTKVLWSACQSAAERAGLSTGTSIPTPCATASPLICSKPAPTCAPSRSCSVIVISRRPPIYLHLSQRHLSATASPLDALTVPAQKEEPTQKQHDAATSGGGRHRSLCGTVIH